MASRNPQPPKKRPTSQNTRPEGAPKPAKKSRRKKEHIRVTKKEMERRRMHRRIFTISCLILAVVAGLVLTFTLLFSISRFEFQDLSGQPTSNLGSYTQEDVLNTMQVHRGDNMFSFKAEEQEELLNKSFPLLETVEVRRRLPNTVVLRVEPAQPTWCIQTSEGWMILSKQYKIIEIVPVQPALPMVIGPVHGNQQPGKTLLLGLPQIPLDPEAPDDIALKPAEQVAFEQVMEMLEKYEIVDQITHVDVSDPEEMYFGYQDRVRVKLGTVNHLDYKIKFAVNLLLNKDGNAIAESDRGILDMSSIRGDGSIRPTFKQAETGLPPLVQPGDLPPPEPEPEPVPEPEAVPAPEPEAVPAPAETPAPADQPTPAPAEPAQPAATPEAPPAVPEVPAVPPAVPDAAATPAPPPDFLVPVPVKPQA